MPSRNNGTAYKEYYVEATAYTAGAESTGKSPGHPAYGLTASGSFVTEGRTIACPQSMDFGTKVYLEGVGYRVCEDRGGAIKEGRIDIFMDSLSDARTFGRKTVKMTVLN